MKLFEWLISQYKAHGTKYLGIAQGVISALAGVAGLIPPAHLPYWMAASAILTTFRGFENSKVTP